MIFSNKENKKSGQVLVETVVALGMLVVGMLGLMSLLSNSIGLSRVISNQYAGSYLAGEGIELVRNIVDNNVFSGEGVPFNDRVASCNSGCGIVEDGNNLSIQQGSQTIKVGSNPTNFKREITVTGSDDILSVISEVSWKARGGDYNIVVSDNIYNWRKAQN